MLTRDNQLDNTERTTDPLAFLVAGLEEQSYS